MMLFLLSGRNSFASVGFLIGFREFCINATNIPAGAIADLLWPPTLHAGFVSGLWPPFSASAYARTKTSYLFVLYFSSGIGEAFVERIKSVIYWRDSTTGEKTRGSTHTLLVENRIRRFHSSPQRQLLITAI